MQTTTTTATTNNTKSAYIQPDQGTPHIFLVTDPYLFVLRFYGPVNPMGSCRARSVRVNTPLLDKLSPLSDSPVLCTFFRQKLTTVLLESVEGSNQSIYNLI